MKTFAISLLIIVIMIGATWFFSRLPLSKIENKNKSDDINLLLFPW